MFTLFKRPDEEDQRIRDMAKIAAKWTRHELSSDISNMSPNELRGYVRARAERVLRDRLTLNDCEFHAEILQRTVHIVIGELAIQPIVSLPMAHIERRAA
jgi:hypothetical protein